jgi:hypothetical protein
MSALGGGDETFAVDADQDARALRQRQSTVDYVDDEFISESAPLLEATGPDSAEDFIDSINKPWLGSAEFNAKPRWRRPSV